MGKNDLLPGTLDMMVLKTLTRGAIHGYGIAQRLRALSEEMIQVEEGSLYPALQRLELNGWVEGEWGMSDGRKRLASETARYREITGAIARVMGMA